MEKVKLLVIEILLFPITFLNAMIPDSSAVLNTVNKVVDWQIEHYSDMNKNRIYKSFGDLSWENGVFLSALSEWAEFRNDSSLISWYRNICERNRYSLSTANHRIYHADDLAVCLMYATLYDKTGKDEVIHHTLSRLEFIMNHPSKAVFGEKSKHVNDRWCWCDALYMAPPVFARFANITGNNKMRDLMDKEFWDTHKFLYDESESLFFRDAKYFKRKEKNGEKVFWGRGNAWVLAGLSRIITYLPSDYPSRSKYISLFKEMASRIVSLQDKRGHWHASMLDPISYPDPEMSCTAFFTYALWWGINNGVLDEEIYLKSAINGWNAIVGSVQKDGMLGWVQPVGQDPKKVTAEMTEVYGPAAVMLAAMEILKFSDGFAL